MGNSNTTAPPPNCYSATPEDTESYEVQMKRYRLQRKLNSYGFLKKTDVVVLPQPPPPVHQKDQNALSKSK